MLLCVIFTLRSWKSFLTFHFSSIKINLAKTDRLLESGNEFPNRIPGNPSSLCELLIHTRTVGLTKLM